MNSTIKAHLRFGIGQAFAYTNSIGNTEEWEVTAVTKDGSGCRAKLTSGTANVESGFIIEYGEIKA